MSNKSSGKKSSLDAVVANLLEKVTSTSGPSITVKHITQHQGTGNAVAGSSLPASVPTTNNANSLQINSTVSQNLLDAQKQNQSSSQNLPQKSSTQATNSLKKLQEKIRVKKAEKAAMKVKVKPMSFLHKTAARPVSKPVGRPLGSTNASRVTKLSSVSGKSFSVESAASRKMRKCRQKAPLSRPIGISPDKPPMPLEQLEQLLPLDVGKRFM